jgi:hypothetical protein
MGVDANLVTNASRLALVPTWFLTVYIAVVMLVPAAWRAWQAYGLASFWIPVSVAVLVDALAFGHGLLGLRWLNYAFVWLAVHQLGFLWRAGRADDRAVAAGWALGGLAFLVFLVEVADYPVSMLTVPGADISNSRPPTVALVALAAMQFGLIVALQSTVSKWLQRETPWTAAVLVNGFIMTLFLWHSTVQVLMIGTAAQLGGIGLTFQPGSFDWWLARPAWIGAMLLVLLPVTALLSRFEHGGKRRAGPPPATSVQVAGGMLMCLGLAFLALQGVGARSFPWIHVVPLVLALGGAAIVLLYRGRDSVK